MEKSEAITALVNSETLEYKDFVICEECYWHNNISLGVFKFNYFQNIGEAIIKLEDIIKDDWKSVKVQEKY